MRKFDLVRAEFPSFRDDVENWLWLDRSIPDNQFKIRQSLLAVDWLLYQFGHKPNSMSDAEKAQFLFEKIGESKSFQFWCE